MARQTSARRARLQVERLENRWLLAADLQIDFADQINTSYDLNDKVADFASYRTTDVSRGDRSVRNGPNRGPGHSGRDAIESDVWQSASEQHRSDRERIPRRSVSSVVQNRIRQTRLTDKTGLPQVSVYVSKQGDTGQLTVARVDIRPVTILFRKFTLFRPAHESSYLNLSSSDRPAAIMSESQAEGESPANDISSRQFSFNETPLVRQSINDPSVPTFLAARSANDIDFLSPNILGASEIQTPGGFIELTSGADERAVARSDSIQAGQGQIFLLQEAQLDPASFSFWLDGDSNAIESEDLIDLLELLGDAEAEQGTEEESDEAGAEPVSPDNVADDAATTEATEQVFSSWDDDAHAGMIQLQRRDELDQPVVERADADINLSDLTLELDAVIGSARTFEFGDAELEIEDSEETESREPVEARRSKAESHDAPLASRAALLPLIFAAVSRRRSVAAHLRRKRRQFRILGMRLVD